jgi:hypothetical protein
VLFDIEGSSPRSAFHEIVGQSLVLGQAFAWLEEREKTNGVLHELVLLYPVDLQGQQDAANHMAPYEHALILPKDGGQGSVVSLGFLEFAKILVAHGLEVLHDCEFLEGIVFVVMDRGFHALLALLEVTEFEIGDSFPE